MADRRSALRPGRHGVGARAAHGAGPPSTVSNRANTIWIQTTTSESAGIRQLAQDLRTAYNDENVRLEAGSVFGKDTSVEIIDGVMVQFAVIFTLLATMSVLIGVVGSLALSGVLSLNVLERRREIGVLRAIGASSAAVGGQFVGEGLILGLLSG